MQVQPVLGCSRGAPQTPKLRNQMPTRPALAQAGTFPWVEKWVNSVLVSSWPLGLLGCELALCPLLLHIDCWLCQGPETWLVQAVGQLVRMAPEAPVAPQSGCQALKFPVDHNSN